MSQKQLCPQGHTVTLRPSNADVADTRGEKQKFRTKDTGRPIPTHGKVKSAFGPAVSSGLQTLIIATAFLMWMVAKDIEQRGIPFATPEL